jgi:hypothetical protein
MSWEEAQEDQMMKEAQDNAADMDIAEAAEYLRKETKKVEKRKSKRKL